MKQTLLVFALFSISSLSQAQCTLPIPSTAEAAMSSGILPVGFEFWVCEGLTITANGDFYILYVEKNAKVTVNGETNVVYQKGPGTLNISGNSNIALYSGNVTVTDNGTGTTKAACPSPIKFTYAEAPTPGCTVVTTGLKDEDNAAGLQLYPNPAKDHFAVDYKGNGRLLSYHIYNLQGKEVQQGHFSTTSDKVSVASLVKGMYVVHISTTSGEFLERISLD